MMTTTDTSTVSARVSNDLASRLAATADRARNPYAPSASQIIARGIELALKEMDEAPSAQATITDAQVMSEYQRLDELAKAPIDLAGLRMSGGDAVRTHDDLHQALFGFTLSAAIRDHRLRLEEPLQKPNIIVDPETAEPIMDLFRANLYTTWQHPPIMGGVNSVSFGSSLAASEVKELGIGGAKAQLRNRLLNLLSPFFGAVALWRQFPEVHQEPSGNMHLHARFNLILWREYAQLLPYEAADYIEHVAQTRLQQKAQADGFDTAQLFPRTVMPSIREQFVRLGFPHYAGCSFAITTSAIDREWDGDINSLPKPDYDHAIFIDGVTDNVLVMRPDANGAYLIGGKPITMKRAR